VDRLEGRLINQKLMNEVDWNGESLSVFYISRCASINIDLGSDQAIGHAPDNSKVSALGSLEEQEI
jgi:hypothetical protein